MAGDLEKRLEQMRELIDLTEGRVDAELTQRAQRVVAKVGARVVMGEQTVVALAGPTGAGKSSLVNAITGLEMANPGVRRPMTSETLAVSFGPANTWLLDWLGVRRRYEIDAGELRDLVLLDLPDHDSVELSHRAEVERLVKVVDQFIWVTDPQKYADASIHQRYLQPLAEHKDVITVVLNQIDRLRPEALEQVKQHLSSLLDRDGLRGVKIFAVSAQTSQGVDQLRRHLRAVAEAKSASAERLRADLRILTDDFDAATRGTKSHGLSTEAINRLEAGMAQAAGVPVVEHAVQRAMVHRGALATGWPLVSWWRRFRPDPLKRLRLGGAAARKQVEAAPVRSSLPERGPVAKAQLATALRAAANEAGGGLPEPWRGVVYEAAHRSSALLPDTLDRAVVETDLGTERTPVWWRLLRFLQWVLIAAVIAGLGWLTINVVLTYFGLPRLPTVPVGGGDGFEIPLPTLLVGGGLLAGFLLSVGSRAFVGLGAGSARRRAGRRLRARIAEIARSEVVEPVQVELQRYERARALVRK